MTTATLDCRPDRYGFRQLLGEQTWLELPGPIQRRFAKLDPGTQVTCKGKAVNTRITAIGQLVRAAAALLRTPLPVAERTNDRAHVDTRNLPPLAPMMLRQAWRREFPDARRSARLIESQKRFTGPTGLEEKVLGGLGMTINLTATDDCMEFRSQRIYCQWRRWRLYLPFPVNIIARHRHLDERHFHFELEVRLPVLGQVIWQRVRFEEEGDDAR